MPAFNSKRIQMHLIALAAEEIQIELEQIMMQM